MRFFSASHFNVINILYVLDSWENELYNEIHFKLNNSILFNEVITKYYVDEKLILEHITLFGIVNEPTSVQVNGVIHNSFHYNKTEEVRIIVITVT